MKGLLLLSLTVLISCTEPDAAVRLEENGSKIIRKDKLVLLEHIVVTKDSIFCFLDSILKHQQLIHYRPMVDSTGLKPQSVEIVERMWNQKFSNDLVEFFKVVNELDRLNPNTYIELIPNHYLLNPAASYALDTMLRNGLARVGMNYDISKSLIPIVAGGSGEYYYYELEGKNKGSIYYTDEGDPNSYVYSSLKDFLKVILTCYQSKVFSVDSTGWFNEDVDKWGQLNLKMSTKYKSYWKSYIEGFKN
jgi:hypothetical protein